MKRFFFLGFIFCIYSHSYTVEEPVDKISIEGLDRVDKSTIQECVRIKPYQKFTQNDIDETLKALFKKDFFSNIKFYRGKNALVIKCTEKPMINKVAFEGNDAANDDALKSVINGRIGEGRLLSGYIIKDILADFQLMYKALGYYSAIISPKLIKHPGNKVDVVFEIKEGTKTTVRKIVFVGNKHFSDDQLKDVMTTKETKIWRFWDYESHVLREDKLDKDIESLTNFYKNRGYPFFMVSSTSAEMDFYKKSHYMTFYLEEGDKFTISGASLDSKVKKIDPKEFRKFIVIEKGDVFNAGLIETVQEKLRKEISLKDNPFIDVAIDVDFDKNKKTAFIKYSIIEHKRLFIERIEIVGNVRTLDRVIRREFSVHEGDAFNAYKVKNAIDQLKYTDFFDDVQVTDVSGSAEDKRVLIVTVKEKDSTAQIRFGLNVSDSDGFGGFLGFVENNLFGTGRVFSTEAFWMQRYYGCKLDIFDPKFLDKNFGAGIKIGANRLDRKKVDQSVLKSAFISPYIHYDITNHLSHRISYTTSGTKRQWWDKENKKLFDSIPDGAKAPLMKDEYGNYGSGELSSLLVYSRADNLKDPRQGYSLSMTNSYSGIIGNVRYFKNDLEGNYYYPLSEKIVFITRGKVGHIHEMKGTRSIHRFALGGDGESMRGFDLCGVGTRDLAGNSVGGDKYWSLSFMAKTPLSSKEVGINGVAFIDLGSAWGTKYPKEKVNDSRSMRASIGVAIEWVKCPLGVPLSFVFGFPIKKKGFDRKQTFTLTGFM